MDQINNKANDMNLPPGKVVTLPSTFQGSPRSLLQNYQDAMAMIAKFGKPDLFLTFTCNPLKSLKTYMMVNNQFIAQIW